MGSKVNNTIYTFTHIFFFSLILGGTLNWLRIGYVLSCTLSLLQIVTSSSDLICET